MNHAIA